MSILLFVQLQHLCKVYYSIVFFQVEEDQEAKEIDCDELLVGDKDDAD